VLRASLPSNESFRHSRTINAAGASWYAMESAQPSKYFADPIHESDVTEL
jgi:hypothetical protein